MLNPMPFTFLKKHNEVNLATFFGFIEADIYAPKTILNPFLPFKNIKTGNILYPHGHFSGIYFSEELKLAASKGYIITSKIGYEFSKENLFEEYVTHFYNKKMHSRGGERFLYKLMLNSIYGYLGRKPDVLKTEIVNKNAFRKLVAEYYIYSYSEFDNDQVIITRDLYPSRELQVMGGIPPSFNIENPRPATNVAIASAITSYARIAMIPVKTDINNPPFYTDTDSIFTSKPLPDSMIGTGLGQFKDELHGAVITKALFLAPKVYGYKKSDLEDKVVIAGVKPNTVTYEELTKIWKGETISKTKTMIVKDLNTMSIKTKVSNLNLHLNLKDSTKTPVFDSNGHLCCYKPNKYNNHPSPHQNPLTLKPFPTILRSLYCTP